MNLLFLGYLTAVAYFYIKITDTRSTVQRITENMPGITGIWLPPPKTGTNHHTVHPLFQQEVRSDIQKL